jgi:hypothetical protein
MAMNRAAEAKVSFARAGELDPKFVHLVQKN